MTKIIFKLAVGLSLMLLCVTQNTFGQAPQKFNYQAVARDNLGQPIADKTLSVRMSILNGPANGQVVYQETHSVYLWYVWPYIKLHIME